MSPKLRIIITTGLPRSGKTTWSKNWVVAHLNWVRISKDDIRTQLFGSSNYGPSLSGYKIEHDKLATEIRNQMILTCLEHNQNVVIDGLHMKEGSITSLKKLLKGKAKVSIRYFVVPLRTCLERNKVATDKTMSEEYIINLSNSYVYSR